MVVIDEDGNLVEVEGDVVPEGCKLPVAALHMDAAAVAELRRRCAEAADEIEDDEDEADGDEHDDGDHDDGDHGDRDQISAAARAYLNAKDQLHYANRRKRWSTPLKAPAHAVTTPSWQRSPWKPRAGGVEMGGAPDSAGDARDAADAARKAYAARSRYLQDAWRRKAGKPPQGPYFRSADATRSPPKVSADWAAAAGGNLPAAGGRHPAPSARHLSDGEAAWQRMVDDLSTRWRTHRKPFVPGDPA